MKQSQDENKTNAKNSIEACRDESNHSDAAPRVDSSGNDAAIASCEQVEMRVHDLMDQRLPLLSDELVRNHVTDCDECAALVVDFGALDDSLSQIPLSTLHRLSGLDSEEEAQRLPRQPLHPFSFIVAVASVLLVMLTSGLWFSDSSKVASSTVGKGVNLRSAVTVDGAVMPPISRDDSATRFVSVDRNSEFIAAFPLHKAPVPADLLRSVSFPNLRLADIRREVEPYLQMTADLPGMKPVTGSVNATYWLLVPNSESSPEENQKAGQSEDADGQEYPGLGFRKASQWQLCCV